MFDPIKAMHGTKKHSTKNEATHKINVEINRLADLCADTDVHSDEYVEAMNRLNKLVEVRSKLVADNPKPLDPNQVLGAAVGAAMVMFVCNAEALAVLPQKGFALAKNLMPRI